MHAAGRTRPGPGVRRRVFKEPEARPINRFGALVVSHAPRMDNVSMTCHSPYAAPAPAGGHAAILRRTPNDRAFRGFTLLELLFAVAIAAVLAVVAAGQYSAYVEKAKVANAKADILVIALAVQRYHNNHFKYPADLAELGFADKLDPWRRPYHYTDLSGKGAKGKARKDHRLNPLNSDFDLFSAGKNGVFKTQVDQKDSLDDVIRARDGSFVDLAAKF